MSDTPQVLLAHHLKALRLPTFLREYDKLARQCAAEGVDHTRYLLRLTELELIDRERRTIERRIKEAKFPAVKSLDSFEFAAIPSLNKTLVLELARSEYVARRENIIAVGNSGTGKTQVALGLGLAACQKGLAVGFTTAAALVNELHEARDEKRLLRLQRQLAGYKLLIVDERKENHCQHRRESTSEERSKNASVRDASRATSHSRRPAPSYCSRPSASATNVARSSSPAICPSMSGPLCLPPNA
jgi:DNA replication protein DnaC